MSDSQRPSRWQPDIDAFRLEDVERGQLDNGALFVGSSTFRLWDGLEQKFAPVTCRNRGFGGATTRDLLRHRQELIWEHKPDFIIYYAGGNDLFSNVPVAGVFQNIAEFASLTLPAVDSKIVFLAIFPHPRFKRFFEEIKTLNSMLLTLCEKNDRLTYCDSFSCFLNANGEVDLNLFADDQIHLNSDGYHVLIEQVRGAIDEPT